MLDCKNGFWQIPVTERISNYLTVSKLWGRYSFKRLLFEISSAPEIVQKILRQLLEGVENAANSMDNILFYAKSMNELKIITKNVGLKLFKAGIPLKKEKCHFYKQLVIFLGHVLTPKGLEVHPMKLETIYKLKIPHDVKSLQRFLGITNYLTKFIPRHSELTAPLRPLLNRVWIKHWTNEHHETIARIKTTLKRHQFSRFTM